MHSCQVIRRSYSSSSSLVLGAPHLAFLRRPRIGMMLALLGCIPLSLLALSLVALGGNAGVAVSVGLYLTPVASGVICGLAVARDRDVQLMKERSNAPPQA